MDIVSTAKSTVSKPIAWAKAAPLAFFFAAVVFLIFGAKLGSKLRLWFTSVPVLGEKLVEFSTPDPTEEATAAAKVKKFMDDAKAAAAKAGGFIGFLFVGGLFGLLAYLFSGHEAVAGGLDLNGLGGGLIVGLGLLSSTTETMDITDETGSKAIAWTPGSADTKVFTIRPKNTRVGGDFLCATALQLQLTTTFDQAASGGSVVNWDDWPRALASLEIAGGVFGTMLDANTGSGPALKNIIEFVNTGYRFGGDRPVAQLAAADGDTVMDLFFTYQFAPDFLMKSEDAALFIGWLQDTQVRCGLAASTALAAVSTGAVTKGTSYLRAQLRYITAKKLASPSISHWRRYNCSASSQTLQVYSGLGGSGPDKTASVDRVHTIAYHSNTLGLGGCSALNTITSLECARLGIGKVENLDLYMLSKLSIMGERRAYAAAAAGTAPNAYAGPPYATGSAVGGAVKPLAATLAWLPIRVPAMGQKITKMPKLANNEVLQIDMGWSSVPSSGSHYITVGSIREIHKDFFQGLAVMAGVPTIAPRRATADKRSAKALTEAGIKSRSSWTGLPSTLT